MKTTMNISGSRRDFLLRAGGGLGALAFACLRAEQVRASDVRRFGLAPRPTHHAAKVKNVIWLFMDGGPSHIDLFDPKPALKKLQGQPLPASFPRPMTAMNVTAHSPLLASTRSFRRHGRSGTWVSDLYPEIARHVDDLCVVRSCVAEGLTHVAGVLQMTTCSTLPGRPSLGAWALYGLGSESQNLPGYVVLGDSASEPPGGVNSYGNGFLPALYQGTRFAEGENPILYASPPPGMTPGRQRGKLRFVQQLNRRFSERNAGNSDLEAQIASYELAYRMQASAPEVVDLRQETAETKRLYGLEDPATEKNGRNCLLARRLVQRGVRFVQVFMGAGSRWDAHSDLDGNHEKYCGESDRPIAGLLADLKRRGLLDSTVVIWGGEFGRTPMSESGNGRDHNPYGFTMWLAGGGVKPGYVYGATDDLGLYAVDNPVHVRDIHATIMHLLGFNHRALTFLHNGREENPTGVGGNVIADILT